MGKTSDRLDKAHRKRLKELEGQLSQCPPKALQQLLQKAIIGTHLCMVTFNMFLESLSRAIDKMSAQEDWAKNKIQKIESAIAEAESLLSLHQNSEHEKPIEISKQLVERLKQHQVSQSDYQVFLLSNNYQFIQKNLISLFEGRDPNLGLDFLIDVLEHIIGYTPAGQLYDALNRIQKRLDKGRKQFEVALDFTLQLEAYAFTSIHWALLTQLMIQQTESLETGGAVSFDEAESDLDRRIQLLKRDLWGGEGDSHDIHADK